MAAVGGQKPWRNQAWTKAKMKLVGNGSETAKHHLNPSSQASQKRRVRNPSTRCRKGTFETL